MANQTNQPITVVGAGPVGCVLATMLARRGFDVTAYEKRDDMRERAADGGRSINLVLTDRGLHALDRLGIRDKVLELTVPVLGRMMHSRQGELTYQPYGSDDSECNHSVSRGQLNEYLLDAAEAAGVKIHFQHELIDADFEANRLEFRVPGEEPTRSVEAPVIFGCDGAPSAVRQCMVKDEAITEEVEFMDWGYKELVFPAAEDGSYPMEKKALHIWPRGGHFLMGLANLDGSFTGTIYLPRKGPNSFAELDDPERIRSFFKAHYADAIPLLDSFVDEFNDHPTGSLGTVRAAPWHMNGQVLLVGDAAHGIVPFFGQGLNCGFEDCAVLDDLLQRNEPFEQLFRRFYESRKPNTDAIADMALENAVEMGEKVANPEFLKRKKVESILERQLGDLYRSRYATVMYSQIPYGVALEVGERQKELLAELSDGLERPEDVDLDRARQLIDEKITPLYEQHEVELDF